MDRIYIYKLLKAPFKFLFFTMDEFLIPIVVLTAFHVMQMGILGLILAGISFWGIRKWNKNFGSGALLKAMYWYGIHRVEKGLVESHKRQWL